ncbi:MAG: hypothetical protein HC828_18490 [Blastochloris sp.]|nr:hypothetical protein [Blastochloris sp.]
MEPIQLPATDHGRLRTIAGILRGLGADKLAARLTDIAARLDRTDPVLVSRIERLLVESPRNLEHAEALATLITDAVRRTEMQYLIASAAAHRGQIQRVTRLLPELVTAQQRGAVVKALIPHLMRHEVPHLRAAIRLIKDDQIERTLRRQVIERWGAMEVRP